MFRPSRFRILSGKGELVLPLNVEEATKKYIYFTRGWHWVQKQRVFKLLVVSSDYSKHISSPYIRVNAIQKHVSIQQMVVHWLAVSSNRTMVQLFTGIVLGEEIRWSGSRGVIFSLLAIVWHVMKPWAPLVLVYRLKVVHLLAWIARASTYIGRWWYLLWVTDKLSPFTRCL